MKIKHFMMPADGDAGTPGTVGGDGTPATPAYLTADDVDKRINGALKNWGGRLEKTIGDKFTSTMTEQFNAFRESMKQAEPAQGAIGDDKKPSPEMLKLRAELDAVNNRLKEEQVLRETKEKEILRREEIQGLQEALSKAGVDGPAIAFARDALYARQLITRNDKGEVCWKTTSEYGEELLPVAQGAAEWVKTEEGKRALPPVATSGTGDKGGQPRANRNQVSANDAISALLGGFPAQ